MINFIKRLFGISDKNKLTRDEIAEAGACPNCWGRQEYADQVRELERDLTKSNINRSKEEKKSFVSQFVETNITGIRLKKDGDEMTCPGCKFKRKLVPVKTN